MSHRQSVTAYATVKVRVRMSTWNKTSTFEEVERIVKREAENLIKGRLNGEGSRCEVKSVDVDTVFTTDADVI
jgi:hypothetical protein